MPTQQLSATATGRLHFPRFALKSIAPEPAAAPYDAERAVPPRLPAQPRVARLLRAAVVLLGTVVLTRGALRLLRALAPLLPRLGFALE